MRRTATRKPIRLTESKLRQIIRSVINESLDKLPGKSFSVEFTHDNKALFDKAVLNYCKHSARLMKLDEDLTFARGASPHECFSEEVYDMNYHSDVQGKKVFSVTTQELPTSDRNVESALQWRFETDENVGFIITLKTSYVGYDQELTCERLFSEEALDFAR